MVNYWIGSVTKVRILTVRFSCKSLTGLLTVNTERKKSKQEKSVWEKSEMSDKNLYSVNILESD
jgi:hypothetical protein